MKFMLNYSMTWIEFFETYNFLDSKKFYNFLTFPFSSAFPHYLKEKYGYFSDDRFELADIVKHKRKKNYAKIIGFDYYKGFKTTKGFCKYFYLEEKENYNMDIE